MSEEVDYSEITTENLQRLVVSETGKLMTAMMAALMMKQSQAIDITYDTVDRVSRDLVTGNKVVGDLLDLLEERLAGA